MTLVEACHRGDRGAVRRHLRADGALDAVGVHGWTALGAACFRKRWDIARDLVAAGASTVSPHRAAPLNLAALHDHTATLELLLRAGADPNARSGCARETALQVAARAGSLRAVRLLLRAGADPNAPGGLRGASALSGALLHREVVRVLLNHGAAVNGVHPLPLRWAEARGDADLAELLLTHGARGCTGEARKAFKAHMARFARAYLERHAALPALIRAVPGLNQDVCGVVGALCAAPSGAKEACHELLRTYSMESWPNIYGSSCAR